MRDRDREELARLRQALAEERERRIVLEDTLRQTEEQVKADADAFDSRRAEIQRTLEERDRLIQNPLFGWATVSLDGALLGCNATFARIFGFDGVADAVSGSGTPFAGLADHAHVAEQLQAGVHLDRVESILHRPDGRPFRALTSAALMAADAEGLARIRAGGDRHR